MTALDQQLDQRRDVNGISGPVEQLIGVGIGARRCFGTRGLEIPFELERDSLEQPHQVVEGRQAGQICRALVSSSDFTIALLVHTRELLVGLEGALDRDQYDVEQSREIVRLIRVHAQNGVVEDDVHVRQQRNNILGGTAREGGESMR